MFAPAATVAFLVAWLVTLILGYGLILFALRDELQPVPQNLGTALYFAATSVLTLGFGPSGRTPGPADLALAEDLASRAAIALDNARLYKELEHADRQKNEFLSMLAHELRNPLAPIRNAAEVIRLSAPDQPRLQWASGRSGLRRMASL